MATEKQPIVLLLPYMFGDQTYHKSLELNYLVYRDNQNISSIFAPYAQDLKDVYTGYENRTPEESEIIDRLEPQIKNAIIEQEVKWIMGEGDVTAEYDAFINSLESLGLSEVLKQYQAARDRYTSN